MLCSNNCDSVADRGSIIDLVEYATRWIIVAAVYVGPSVHSRGIHLLRYLTDDCFEFTKTPWEQLSEIAQWTSRLPPQFCSHRTSLNQLHTPPTWRSTSHYCLYTAVRSRSSFAVAAGMRVVSSFKVSDSLINMPKSIQNLMFSFLEDF